MSDLEGKTFYPLILQKDGSIGRTEKPVVFLEDAQKKSGEWEDQVIKLSLDLTEAERRLERIRQFLISVKTCETGCEIFEKTKMDSERSLICETSRACGACPMQILIEWLKNEVSGGSEPLTTEELADLEVSEKEIRGGKCKTFDSAEEMIEDLHKSREPAQKPNYPTCPEHGAMNKVSKYGMWRCLTCHKGYDESTGKYLKDSSEGFKEKKETET